MIKRQNVKDVGVAPFNVSATVPPHAPTAAAVIARTVAKRPGRVKGLVVCVAVAGTPGNSTDFKQVVRVRNAAQGAGTTVITDDAVLADMNTAPDTLPAAGTILKALGLSSAADVQAGQILEVHYSESGTIGTATRATFSIVDLLYESANHMDSII